MKIRNIVRKLFAAACGTALLFSIVPTTARADVGGNDAKYTYTVTLLAGGQGSFAGASGVQVSGSGSVTYQDGGQIRITGLNYGDRISLSPQSGMVSLPEDSKYYVRGIRESGRDNNTVGNSSFMVDSDREYVIAYGIRGNMVSYRVNYQDQNGNTLLESQTFYGAVGDRPVVAFQYVDGYQPQAYNLTGTLSGNEAENIFTFTYTPVEQPAAGTGTAAGGTDTSGGGAGDTAAAPGTAAGGTGGTAATPGTAAGGAGDAAAPDADGGTAAADDGAADEGGAAEPDAGAEDEAAQPREPQEIVDIDDEETPLGNLDLPDESGEEAEEASQRPAGNMPLFIGIAAAAILALGAGAFLLIRRRR